MENEYAVGPLQREKDKQALENMESALSFLRYIKPNKEGDHVDRELDRRYMITIARLELAIAYFATYLVRNDT
jgi:hypothetical protein